MKFVMNKREMFLTLREKRGTLSLALMSWEYLLGCCEIEDHINALQTKHPKW